MEKPEAAVPVLGSSLLAADIKNGVSAIRFVGSGSPAIDDLALRGGFRCGEITSIAGAADTGKEILVLNSIASYLISEKDSEIALIDTNGSFDVVRLRDIISHHLRNLSHQAKYKQTGYVYERASAEQSAEATENFAAEATHSMLGRVKLIRAFDFSGIVEAVDEVGELLEQSEKKKLTSGAEKMSANVQLEHEKEISDSQGSTISESQGPEPTIQPTSPKGIGMLVIDNIFNPVSSMMAKSTMQGQALLTTFLRSLHQLTYHYHICTILLNSAVGLGPTTATDYTRRMAENASVFYSTMGKPALGRTYANLIDTSIFMSKVPKTKDDAEMAFGAAGERRDPGRWKAIYVLEVVKDRFGGREGRWVAFEVKDGGEIKPWG